MTQIYVSSFVFPQTKEGAYSTIKIENNEREVIIGEKINTTKERIELKGIIRGLELIENREEEIEIISEQKKVLNVIERLKKVDIITIEDINLWAKYLHAADGLNIKTRLIEKLDDTKETKECFMKALSTAMKLKDQNSKENK